MTITEVLTLLLVIFAALTYIDNRHNKRACEEKSVNRILL